MLIKDKKIIVYTTSTCRYCQAVKDFFREHKLAYEEIDVGADPKKAREIIEKSGQMGVPVIVIGEGKDESLVVGFDRERLIEVLEIDV